MEIDYLEFFGLDENLLDDKKEEESYRFIFLVESLKEMEKELFFEIEEFVFFVKIDNYINIGVLKEERIKVFCNDVFFSDDSFELDFLELDLGISLLK